MVMRSYASRNLLVDIVHCYKTLPRSVHPGCNAFGASVCVAYAALAGYDVGKVNIACDPLTFPVASTTGLRVPSDSHFRPRRGMSAVRAWT